METPEYKLTYFNARGRAELIRYIFAFAGVEYIDERFENDDWPKYKTLAPFGQSPYITINGKTYGQTHAIADYLARKYGLVGNTPLEDLKVKMIVECTRDVFTAFIAGCYEIDPTKKVALSDKFYNEQLPIYFSYIENFLDENKETGGYFVGKCVTLADLAVFNLIEEVSKGDVMKKYPKLEKFSIHISEQPKIAAWIAKRSK